MQESKTSIEHLIQHIREKNDKQIKDALARIKNKLATLFSSNQYPETFSLTEEITLVNHSGNPIRFDLRLLFDGIIIPDSRNQWQDLSIVIVNKGHADAEIKNLAVPDEPFVVAFRSWKISRKKDNPSVLQVLSELSVSESLRLAGIGRALVIQGEVIKDLVAQVVATSFKCSSVSSYLNDGSDHDWTSRTVALMPGYTQTKNPRSFVKVEQITT